MRLGILGGTFDPVHLGHLAIAQTAMKAASLDRVAMIPCALPPHKDRAGLTDGFHRFAMVSLLVPGAQGIAVSALELLRGGVSYTVETLLELSRRVPKPDLFLLVGSDSYAELPTWRSPEQILSLAAIVVIPRGEDGEAELRRSLPRELSSILLQPGEAWPASLEARLPLAGIVSGKPVPISSTEVRRRVARGESIAGLVPEPVAAYIERQELYA